MKRITIMALIIGIGLSSVVYAELSQEEKNARESLRRTLESNKPEPREVERYSEIRPGVLLCDVLYDEKENPNAANQILVESKLQKDNHQVVSFHSPNLGDVKATVKFKHQDQTWDRHGVYWMIIDKIIRGEFSEAFSDSYSVSLCRSNKPIEIKTGTKLCKVSDLAHQGLTVKYIVESEMQEDGQRVGGYVLGQKQYQMVVKFRKDPEIDKYYEAESVSAALVSNPTSVEKASVRITVEQCTW